MITPVSSFIYRRSHLRRKQTWAIALYMLAFATLASAQTWTSLTHQPGVPVGTTLLLTDGTVMAHQMNSTGDFGTGQWLRLTPDSSGSYINGTWSSLASLPSGYSPTFYASAVLSDGRVVVEGGEYNNGQQVETNLGAIYNPATNTWTSITPPSGVTQIGDASGAVLSNGTFMIGICCFLKNQYLLNASTLTWAATDTSGTKADSNTEEGWTLLSNGKLLTVDTQNGTNSEVYNPSTGSWSSAGSTIVQLAMSGSLEIGPGVLRPDGTVFVAGGTSNTAIYNSATGAWSVGPTFPSGLDVADGPAALLPNGNVLVESSPGLFNNGAQFFEFNGTNLLSVPAAAGASGTTSFKGRMLVLPTGQILFTSQSGTVQIYTPSGTFQSAWRPTITSVATSLNPGSANNAISGTQFNGLSQGAMYGDDAQSATNYPLVRITNNSTGHVFYAKTHNHSTMAVATGGTTVSTQFDVPAAIEGGASTLQVVANGIPSAAVAVTIVTPPAPGTGSITFSGQQVPADGTFGYIDLSVNNVLSCEVIFQQGDLPWDVANRMASAVNSGCTSFITASVDPNLRGASDVPMNMTAKTTGAGTNYPFSISYRPGDPQWFTLTPSGATLTGGHN